MMRPSSRQRISLVLLAQALSGASGCASEGDAQAPRTVAVLAPSVARPSAPTPSIAPPAPEPVSPPVAIAPIASDALGLQPLNLDAGALQQALASVPALAELARNFARFTDADVDAALRRGDRTRSGIGVFTFLPAFAWVPAPGKQLWVISGRSGTRALVAVLHAPPGGRLTHAASTVIDEAETTIAVGASIEHPQLLTWSTCYDCPGEGGAIRWHDDGRVVFSYR